MNSVVIPIMGHVAFGLTAMSFFYRDMLVLRALAIGAGWASIYPLIRQGDELDELTLIYNGEVAVEINGKQVSRTRDGTLIGEISFIKGGPATANVTACGPVRYLVWPKLELQNLLKRNPSMDISMKTVFSMELIKKIGGDDMPAQI